MRSREQGESGKNNEKISFDKFVLSGWERTNDSFTDAAVNHGQPKKVEQAE